MKTGLALTLAAAVSVAGADRIVFVSPGGDDANAGTRASPLATAAGARDFVRRLRAGGDTGPSVVEFADGVYRIAEPLSLDARDSQVTWRAANRTKTVLSGAVVPKWKKANDDVLEAAVPGAWDIPGFTNGSLDDPAEAECPIGLYQDGRRLSCARWPNGEYARSGRSFGAGARTNEWGKGTFTSGDYRFDSPIAGVPRSVLRSCGIPADGESSSPARESAMCAVATCTISAKAGFLWRAATVRR